MAKTSKQKSGAIGEEKAVRYLEGLGYRILERNFRYKYHEIDLIALKDNYLVFVEVKSRVNDTYGNPEDFVWSNQKRSVRQAAESYLELYPWEGFIRFDIISLLPGEITHFKDAF